MKSVYFYTEDELTVPPANEEERAWIKKMNALFSKMPRRLKLLESADGVNVVDEPASHITDMEDGGAERAGIVLAMLPEATMRVTSVSA